MNQNSQANHLVLIREAADIASMVAKYVKDYEQLEKDCVEQAEQTALLVFSKVIGDATQAGCPQDLVSWFFTQQYSGIIGQCCKGIEDLAQAEDCLLRAKNTIISQHGNTFNQEYCQQLMAQPKTGAPTEPEPTKPLTECQQYKKSLETVMAIIDDPKQSCAKIPDEEILKLKQIAAQPAIAESCDPSILNYGRIVFQAFNQRCRPAPPGWTKSKLQDGRACYCREAPLREPLSQSPAQPPPVTPPPPTPPGD